MLVLMQEPLKEVAYKNYNKWQTPQLAGQSFNQMLMLMFVIVGHNSRYDRAQTTNEATNSIIAKM